MQTLIAKDDLHFEEYPVLNWKKGEKYNAVEKDDLLIVDSETGPFYFSGEARRRLPEVFEFVEGGRNSASFHRVIV